MSGLPHRDERDGATFRPDTELEALERFMSKVLVPACGGCWIWTGATGTHGYGVTSIERRQIGAHRLSHLLWNGPIPDGFHVDHLCRNTLCVRPDHIEAVTVQTNTLRGIGPSAENATKTHCPQGHPYDEANTCVKETATGGTRRACRACARDAARIYRQRKVAS